MLSGNADFRDAVGEDSDRTMTVVEAPYQNSSVITLTCYDNASRFDRDYSESTLKYPATRSQIYPGCVYGMRCNTGNSVILRGRFRGI